MQWEETVWKYRVYPYSDSLREYAILSQPGYDITTNDQSYLRFPVLFNSYLCGLFYKHGITKAV